MALARSLPFYFAAVSLLAFSLAATFGRESGDPLPPRPESRIHDSGSVFDSADREPTADRIRMRLDELHEETGCDVLVVTVTTTTGSSPRRMADRFAANWIAADNPGAVLLYERAGNRLAVSTAPATRDSIADYHFAAIEQSTLGEDRQDVPPAEVVSLAAADLGGLFRKYFGTEIERTHPSVRFDRILMAVIAGLIAVIVAVVAALHWRGEKARVHA